jgi:hypothetical protein
MWADRWVFEASSGKIGRMSGGKTYHGLGEIEAGFRDEALEGEESRGAHSGPTVVDAVKVEEGLEELRRSLDPPAGGRPTAVGHSSGTSLVRQTIAPDPLRGTMFGHSIHLPDVNTPDDLPDEPAAVSGSLEPVDPSAPAHLSPFPLADALSTGLAISQAEPARPPPRLDPFRRHEGGFPAPDEETDQVLAPRRSLFGRAVLVVAGLGLVAVIVAFLIRGNDADEAWTPPPPSTGSASSASTPTTAEAPPVAAPTAAPSPAAPAVPPEQPAGAAAAPAAAAETPAPTAAKPTEPVPGIEPPPVRKRRASRRAAAVGGERATDPRPPANAAPAVEEDPDATLPPSTLD